MSSQISPLILRRPNEMRQMQAADRVTEANMKTTDTHECQQLQKLIHTDLLHDATEKR